jgi:zinc protease
MTAFTAAGRGLVAAGLLAAGLYSTILPATAMEIQEITTPGGISAWLVQDDTVPIVAVKFAFAGGASQDPDGREGLANLLSATLDEGAGDLDSQAFQTRLEDLSVRIGFDAGRDNFYGSLRTLTPNLDDAFEMLRLAVTEPRFDTDAVERMKRQIVSGLRREATDPDAIAGRVWAETAFPGHPYGRPSNGTEESVAALSSDDLKALHKRIFTRKDLKVSVVGAIGPERLAALLDSVFAGLPADGELTAVPDTELSTEGGRKSVALDVPQTSIRIGLPALKRDDPDFIAAFVMNHILGGGSFSSWLYEEVREKRGLAYSVGSYLVPYQHAGMWVAATGTRSDRAEETLSIIQAQIARMINEGPSAEELAKAKAYLTGSYALRFDTSDKIADQLLGIQVEGLGRDYIERRNALIEAVTLDDVRRAADRILKPAPPLVVTVGAGAS